MREAAKLVGVPGTFTIIGLVIVAGGIYLKITNFDEESVRTI